ncbi:hypothetical protein [Corynebacterium auris]|uniref:hypothetical protein n=1 Tax=Corynebacterium auris TaxID=44750 RepID=UPI0025B5CA19|nr:hypothetical protein [Corynebacterium auris]
MTFGLFTFIAATGVGLYLGVSIGVSLDTMGAAAVIQATWAYTPFELLGLTIACAAGFYPTCLLLLRGVPEETAFLPRWRVSVQRSFPLILSSFAFICIGIVVEALVVTL